MKNGPIDAAMARSSFMPCSKRRSAQCYKVQRNTRIDTMSALFDSHRLDWIIKSMMMVMMTGIQLKQKCNEEGLANSGSKARLVERSRTRFNKRGMIGQFKVIL